MNITGDKLFHSFLCVGKSFLCQFPQACIIYLGPGRTWYSGPQITPQIVQKPKHFGYLVSLRTRKINSFGSWTQKQTEQRKIKCLRSSQICILPVYRSLRNRFVQIIKKNHIREFPLYCHLLAPKKFFFNNIFRCLRECHIYDQFGHLSDSGNLLIIKRIESIFKLSQSI
jgi:hypothetical protein